MLNGRDYNKLQREQAQARRKIIREMRRSGQTWTEIGKILGVTRQRAQQIGSAK